MKGRRVFALLAIGATVTTVACQLLLQEPELSADAGADAGSDVGLPQDAGVDVLDLCTHAAPPPRPPPGDARAPSLPPVWLAMDALELQPLDGGLTERGFDLDGLCTCFDGPTLGNGGGSCRPRLSTGSANGVCDEDGGVDDALDPILENLNNLSGGRPASFQPNIAGGLTTLLGYITDYNGEADDDAVSVAFGLSPGLYSRAPCDGGEVDPDAGLTLAWQDDDCNAWAAGTDFAEAQPEDGGVVVRPILTQKAYVTNHTLVVDDFKIPFTLRLGSQTIVMADPVLVAKFEVRGFDDAGAPYYVATALMTGRVGVAALLAAVGAVGINVNQPGGGALCNANEFIFDVVRKQICQNLDVVHDRSLDGKDQPCDALSLHAYAHGRTTPVAPYLVPAKARPSDCDASQFEQPLDTLCHDD